MAPFKYEPLVGPNVSIRLLEIELDPNENCISCSLTERSIEAAEGQYIALSHVWGNDFRTAKILLNGQAYYTTPQTWQFLRLARERGIQENLWIDAICIDQSRPLEKSQQIPLMGRIYSNAKSLISWLWSPVTAFDIQHSFSGPDPKEELFVGHGFDSNLLKDLSGDGNRQALLRLIFHSYWSRLWIVQEIRLCQERMFWWEGQILSSAKLEKLAGDIFEHLGGNHTDAAVLNRKVWDLLCGTGQPLQENDRPTLLNHLFWRKDMRCYTFNDSNPTVDMTSSIIQYGRFRCALQSDHVLGLLGLIVNGESFIVDSTMTHADLLAQIYGFNQHSVTYDLFAKMAAVLGNFMDGGVLLQRLNRRLDQELADVVQAVKRRSPSLVQRIDRLCQSPQVPFEGKATGALQWIYGRSRLASRALQDYSRPDSTRASYDEALVRMIEELKQNQKSGPVLHIPFLGMYYFLGKASNNKSVNDTRVVKVMKVTSTRPNGHLRELTIHLSRINNQEKEGLCPALSLQTGMMAMLTAGMSMMSAGQPESTNGKGNPQQSLTHVSWSLLDLFKVFEMSKDSHAVWQGSQCWHIPLGASTDDTG